MQYQVPLIRKEIVCLGEKEALDITIQLLVEKYDFRGGKTDAYIEDDNVVFDETDEFDNNVMTHTIREATEKDIIIYEMIQELKKEHKNCL